MTLILILLIVDILLTGLTWWSVGGLHVRHSETLTRVDAMHQVQLQRTHHPSGIKAH